MKMQDNPNPNPRETWLTNKDKLPDKVKRGIPTTATTNEPLLSLYYNNIKKFPIF